jgi:hypothetical protein
MVASRGKTGGPESKAAERILHYGCRERRRISGGIAYPAQCRHRPVDTEGVTPYAAGAALSAGRGLAALTSAFDLAMHAVNLSEHVFRSGLHFQVGQLTVCIVLNAEFLLDGIEHLQHSDTIIVKSP